MPARTLVAKIYAAVFHPPFSPCARSGRRRHARFISILANTANERCQPTKDGYPPYRTAALNLWESRGLRHPEEDGHQTKNGRDTVQAQSTSNKEVRTRRTAERRISTSIIEQPILLSQRVFDRSRLTNAFKSWEHRSRSDVPSVLQSRRCARHVENDASR